MRVLVATWDGAGNLPPTLALIDALVRRGHDVRAIGHDVQRSQLEAAGATFVRYDTLHQWDQGVPGWLGDEPERLIARMHVDSGVDVLATAARLTPDVALIDCMLPAALTSTRDHGVKTVALVHAVYSYWAEFQDGFFRGPIDAADLALGMTYPAFDPGTAFPPNLVFVGPLRPELGAEPRPRASAGSPYVVASLSTGYQTPGQQDLLQRVCDALGALEVEALVTTGRGIEPDSLTRAVNTVVERRVPHDAVLPGADLLVTHGGHGTVMAGLRYGVPMLCLPPVADQPFNARKVEELGLGVALDPAAPTEEIRSAIGRMLADGAMKARSKAFAAQVSDAPGLGKAVESIEALLSGPGGTDR
jgi:UDP:flavonoid glycosyltransferase YjiC (YdhE family)